MLLITCKRNRDFFTHRLSCVKKRHKFLLIEELLVDRQLTELQDEHDAYRCRFRQTRR